jgi:putative transcriptional regulator
LIQPVRHPSEELIFDFARGAMEPGRGLVLATHLIACPACRAAAQLAEAVGGALIDELEPAELSGDALARAMARLDVPVPAPMPAPRMPDDWIGIPAEVRVAAKRNRRWAAPGVWVAPVTRDRRTGARSYLLGIGPGIAVPRHTHRGLELVCVLKGAYHDRGDVYGPGDFAESDEAIEHRPRVTMDGECVCFAAADNALVARDLIGRLMQPLVRI